VTTPPSDAPGSGLRVCYVVNQYPKVSHSFIRREITAVEDLGATVDRVSVRGWDLELVDEKDVRERSRTFYILKSGMGPLLSAAARVALRSPAAFARALATTLRFARTSDRGYAHHLVYLLEAAVLAERVKAGAIQHIHAHFGTNSTDVAMLASLLSGVPFSFTAHGADEYDKPVQLNLPAKIHAARFGVAISHFGRGQLMRWCDPADWSRLHVVHCGLDDEFLAAPHQPVPGSAPQPVPLAANRFVCVGRLCKEKAQLILVEAAARLRDAGVDVEIVLAGDGEMRAQVEDAIRRHGVQDRVSITGWIDGARVRREIEAARAVVLPSLTEGIPVALMEAMALGRTVVTTFVGGIPELVRSGENGWIVPCGDVDAVAGALRDCLQSPDDRLAEMAAAGRRRILADFNAAIEARRLIGRIVAPVPAAT